VGFDVGKSEHSGAKRGEGGWGPKAMAKAGAKKLRRTNDRLAAQEDLGDTTMSATPRTLEASVEEQPREASPVVE
jgi:hypothetical protein